ncbi:unnamed protein product [Trichobilharzia regenti]|uniref:Dilute domain-containing protein n=1 Tax=Trichobilharzia regenti TaxID=157069 RepID=A0A183VTX3_TRIRE|nr:unnamed protein product [Trichobilharzia regenti]VDP99808.1 unnamed protein product [Trichobilharzia regenti]
MISNDVKEKSSIKTNSISLAEILAKFTLNRSLYVNESSALCYQLLDQLESQLVAQKNEKKFHKNIIALENLCYPTLGNIQIADNGSAYIRETSKKSVNNLTDWLTALSETLERHTLWDSTNDQSNLFITLIDDLKYPHANSILKSIEMWKKSCLYLCSLEEQNYLSSLKVNSQQYLSLKNLQLRSSKAEMHKLLGGQLKQTISITGNKYKNSMCSGLVSDNFSSSKNETNCNSDNEMKQTPTEKQAFIQWVEKWRCVNAEFIAKQLVRDSKPSRETEGDIYQDLDKSSDTLNRCMISSVQEKTIPGDYGVYMDTLKTMYRTLVSRPLSTLHRGIKEVAGQLKTHKFKHSEGVNRTLKEMRNLFTNH